MVRTTTATALAVGVALAPAGAAAASPTRTTPAGTPSPSPSAAALPLAVTLLGVTPSAYDADDPARSLVTVRVGVRNTTRAALTGLRARLVVQRAALVTRQSVQGWATAPATRSLGSSTVSSARVDVGTPSGSGGELPAGATTEVVLTLPAADLPGTGGAHASAVEVLTGDGRAGLVRTFVTAAAPGTAPTRITLLLPLVAGRTGEAGEDGGVDGHLSAAEVGAQLTPDGRLTHLLAAGTDPRVSWALDPALLASVTALASPAAPATGPATPDAAAAGAPAGDQAAAAAWLAALRSGAAGRDVLPLPYADPDLASLARTPAGDELLAAADAGSADAVRSGLGDAPADVLEGVAWPADEAAGAAVVGLAARAGDRALVVDDVSTPTTDDDLTYTPTGRRDLTVGTTRLAALVADATLSDVFADVSEPAAGAALVQRFVAEAATTSLQRPNDPRSLLAVAPRSVDPDPATVQALTTALQDSGYAQLQGVEELLATPAPDVARSGPVLPPDAARGQLPVAHVDAVAGTVADVDAFGTALQGEDALLADRRRAALALLSVSWRGHAEELPGARDRVTDAVAALAAGVRIVGGSTRNLAATRSELPVTVVNELDVPVTVQVVLRARAPRVQLGTVAEQTIAAGSQLRVAVPVRALANGTVVVDATLRAPGGSQIGQTVPVTLNVRMGVEGWITGAVGGLAALLLVVGVVRAVRRPRRRMDEAEQALPVPEAPGLDPR
nr:DUF6049 family protein [Kineococcus siccus]